MYEKDTLFHIEAPPRVKYNILERSPDIAEKHHARNSIKQVSLHLPFVHPAGFFVFLSRQNFTRMLSKKTAF